MNITRTAKIAIGEPTVWSVEVNVDGAVYALEGFDARPSDEEVLSYIPSETE